MSTNVFLLKKLSLENNEVDCKYVIRETSDDGIVTVKESHVKDSRPVHKDLNNLFLELLPIVAEVFRWATDGNIRVTGVAFAGKEENVGITISGTYFSAAGFAKFKTPRIKFKAGDTDICAKLTVIADALVRETEAYLLYDKTAEMGTFGE